MLHDDNSAASLHFGRITAVDAKTCRIRVELPERDNLVTWWLHVPQHNTHDNKYRKLPDLGAHAMVLIAANGVDGAYLGSIYSGPEPPPVIDDHQDYVRFADGTEIFYDPASHTGKINGVGKVEIIAAETVLVQAGQSITLDAPTITLTGDTTIEGSLAVTGSSVTHRGTEIGDTHVHTKVTPGLGNTDKPL